MQNYKFKVTHKPSKKIAHVDALSRSVGYVNESPLEHKLEFRQLADSRIREISGELEFKASEKFELIDGLIYKIDGDKRKFVFPER